MLYKSPLSVVDDPCCCKACICLCSGRQAGRPAVRMQQLAWAQAQECCVCCLNTGLSQCRPRGLEGRKLQHVYIAELSVAPPPQWLIHFCSNIHKCGDDPRWCRCSQLCLNTYFFLSECVCVCVCEHWTLIASTFFPAVGVCCFNLEAWIIDKKCYKGAFITLRMATRRDIQTDEAIEGNLIASTKVLSKQGASHWHTVELSSNCCLNYLLWSNDKSLTLLPSERKMHPGIGMIFVSV